MSDNTVPIIETRNLKKYFKVSKGLLHAVDDVNLKIYPGRTLGVVGESGCVKSTLGRTILRLIERAAEAIHRTGGWIGICGELAADLHLTQRFADMRIDELSVSPPYLLGVRGKVTECV